MKTMKDPAFLFYPNDYLGGTTGMTFEEKGAYIELLIMQFNKGAFTKEQAKKLLNGHFELLWEVLKEKFVEENGKFFNKRLESEKNKRADNAQKNKERIKKYWDDKKKKEEKIPNEYQIDTKPIPLEIENENENEIISKDLGKSENPLKEFLLIPEMQKIFKKDNPQYFTDDSKDFEPLLKISGYIAKIHKLPENVLAQTASDKNEICLRWGELTKFISTEEWFKNYSLMQIEKHFQSIISRKKNGSSKTHIQKPSIGRDIEFDAA